MFTVMDDQLIDTAMARALHRNACRDHALVAWCVWYDHPAFPGRYIAQLKTDETVPYYTLIAESLSGLRAQLPPGLVHHDRQPWYAPEIIELWSAA